MIASSVFTRSLFPSFRSSVLSCAAFAALLTGFAVAPAQEPSTPSPTIPPTTQTQTSADGKVTTTTTTTTDTSGKTSQSVSSNITFHRGKKKGADKEDKVVQSKATKKAIKNEHKVESLAGVDAKLPDKQLFDKAIIAMNKGHYDIARLDLQTMLNTYPNSEYQMRAKLAVADSWYKEGGTAALTQAESEYADFRVFFPNVPEAAEAQMRIGDIYFRQMDRPDRDYAKSLHAEEEYRRMLTDYPQSSLVPQARQRLREVQEVLATREADIASYYATRDNFAAVIARYQTVVDTYPLYSHMDDVLVGLGDAYEAQARYVRGLTLPEAGKARLEELYDGQAAACYRKVVLEHSASQHVEDARDRLTAMNLPVPQPTPAQVAASEELENSRSSYRMTDRVSLLFLHRPDTVLASKVGDPTLTDPKATVAPTILKNAKDQFASAFAPPAPAGGAPVAPKAADPSSETAATPDTPATAAPLAFEDVRNNADPTSATTMTAAPAGRTSSPSTGIGVEIISHPAAPPIRPSVNSFLKPVVPANAAPLPAVEKPAAAPDVPNEVTGATPAAQAPNAKGKASKPAFDKGDESSSKHKKKKGIKKLDPLPQ